MHLLLEFKKFINDSTGFITCKDTLDNAVILKTSDFGHNWVEVKVLNGNLFKDITFISDSIGFVVGTNGYILKTVNMGENWQFINSNSSYTLNSIDFLNDTIGCIVGNNGIILKSNDLGQTWVQESFINTNDLIYVRLFEDELIYVNDYNGHLYSKNSPSGVIKNWRNDILVYPNPSDEVINISIPENIQYFNAVLYDMQGQRIRTSCEEKLSLIGLTKGIYVLEIVSKQGVFRKNIIKN